MHLEWGTKHFNRVPDRGKTFSSSLFSLWGFKMILWTSTWRDKTSILIFVVEFSAQHCVCYFWWHPPAWPVQKCFLVKEISQNHKKMTKNVSCDLTSMALFNDNHSKLFYLWTSVWNAERANPVLLHSFFIRTSKFQPRLAVLNNSPISLSHLQLRYSCGIGGYPFRRQPHACRHFQWRTHWKKK